MRPGRPVFNVLPLTIRTILQRQRLQTSPNRQIQKTDQPSESSLSGSESVLNDDTHERVIVKGWLKSVRGHKNVTFATLNDGSCDDTLQAVFRGKDLSQQLNMGMAVELKGTLQPSKGKGQFMELIVDQQKVLGGCDLTEYPIQRKHQPRSYLRDHGHLRFKTSLTGSIMRLRDGLMRDWHDWFEENEFVHVHTPILTSSDCEGAGEVFTLQNMGTGSPLPSSSRLVSTDPLLSIDSTLTSLTTPIKVDSPCSSVTESTKSPTTPTQPTHQPFFPHPVNLTVSSQLHLEAPTHALSRTYTLSPCFRSEPSITSRHLAEFYMLEGEVVVDNLDSLLDVVEDGIKYCLETLFNSPSKRNARMRDDLSVIHRSIQLESPLPRDISNTAGKPFMRKTYTEAIEHVNKHYVPPTDRPLEWGMGIPTEYEKMLASEFGPIFVTRYPQALKPFYMLPTLNQSLPDRGTGDTVECFDLLVPEIGELIGGSLREHRLDHLLSKLDKTGLDKDEYGWYLDLRRFGSIPHGGWGMGFDRWISFISGVNNVRDTVAFPRWMGHCKY